MERLERAIAAIDALNAKDPNRIVLGAREGPKEQLHAELVTEWVRRLDPKASETMLLAARAHHLERWTMPRADHPAGRAGYLRWRRDLQDFHARRCAELLSGFEYTEAEIDRVGQLIRKRGLGRDAEVQTLEDALCLVFFETQAADFAAKEADKVDRILDQTLRKMSSEGRRAAARLPLADSLKSAIAQSLARIESA